VPDQPLTEEPATEDIISTAERIVADADPAGVLPKCGIRSVQIGTLSWDLIPKNVEQLLGRSDSSATVALVMDRTPIRRNGVEIKPAIEAALRERFGVRQVVLDDGHPELHASEAVIAEAAGAVRGADAVVSIGGGTITDIGKVASAEAGNIPLVVVQTAASVDGFTDDVSVLLKQGVKRTVPSRWPDVVLADVDTIDQAPRAMNVAGFGEINSMFTAPADWLLAQRIGVDTSFHLGPVRLLEEVGSGIADWSAGLGRSTDSTQQLTRALAIRGIATGVSGGTACLSGVEHLVSHMIDLSNGAAHRPIGLHGAQVGAASVVAACAWQLLFDRLDVEPQAISTGTQLTAARAVVESAFAELDPAGSIAAECWADYQRKSKALAEHREDVVALLAGWPSAAADLRPLVRPAEEIAAGLVGAGAPARLTDLDAVSGPDQAFWAVANAPYMRNRLTVLDLLFALGWWTHDDVRDVLDRAEQIVAAAEASHAAR
jgi:glycerol-1-phosphate dehydrogenase [NAD(P)+]